MEVTGVPRTGWAVDGAGEVMRGGGWVHPAQ